MISIADQRTMIRISDADIMISIAPDSTTNPSGEAKASIHRIDSEHRHEQP
jgi:hypothetical protein